MKIDLKKPKYVIPILMLPFLCFFFYLWQDNRAPDEKTSVKQEGLQPNIGEASAEVRKKQLDDKLNAYRNTYKEADGYTAVVPLDEQQKDGPQLNSSYTEHEKFRLDSIDQAMKAKMAPPGRLNSSARQRSGYTSPGIQIDNQKYAREDRALTEALNKLNSKRNQHLAEAKLEPRQAEKDPMELFKAQMSYVDSVQKANDPEYKAERIKIAAQSKAVEAEKAQPALKVEKADAASDAFNTILPERNRTLITAIIDESVTGYADSRIRIRLLEDIKAGSYSIPKGTYLFAFIYGFSGQRVNLEVRSVLLGDRILPVKLSLFDQDGQPGLFVPASAFREFTKELGGNSMQGVQIQGSSGTGNQFLMSTVDKMFQSTSSAIASAIRKNKAKIKYSTHVYLIDQRSLQNQ